MDNINTGGLDWMVNEKEKDGHQFNEEKGKALKERPITHAEPANNYGDTQTHHLRVERHFETPLQT